MEAFSAGGFPVRRIHRNLLPVDAEWTCIELGVCIGGTSRHRTRIGHQEISSVVLQDVPRSVRPRAKAKPPAGRAVGFEVSPLLLDCRDILEQGGT